LRVDFAVEWNRDDLFIGGLHQVDLSLVLETRRLVRTGGYQGQTE
jgi:hypothetical protein